MSVEHCFQEGISAVPIGKDSAGADRVPWAHLRIPPFPRIAIEVLQIANDPRASIRQLSDLISTDPAFSSEVLTLINSALYARPSPIHNMLQATVLLGINALKGVCLTVGVRAYLGHSLNQHSLRSIWRHSLACALVAEQLAIAGRSNKDTAYTAGVLHDIGRLALAVIRPNEYATLIMSYCGSTDSILEQERDLFGFDHCQAGKLLVADWKLPAAFEAIVCDHHASRSGDSWHMADLIKASCRLADCAGFAVFPGGEMTPYEELLADLPERERKSLSPDAERFSFSVSSKINALEMTA